MKLRKCIILLPTSYNDGTEVAPKTLSDIRKRIDIAFDGHTFDGICEGSYKMADGTMSKDKSLKIWIAVDPDRIDELKNMVRTFAKILKQESIYFEMTDAEVEFVKPFPAGDES